MHQKIIRNDYTFPFQTSSIPRIIFTASLLNAQTSGWIKGVLRDISTLQPVPSVSVSISGQQKGVISDANGTFSIQVATGKYVLILQHLTFEEKQVEVSINNNEILNLGSISLIPKVIGLDEVHVISSFVSEKGIPVAVSTVSSKTIENQSGNQDYPEILKLIPGVYATKSGGGNGDNRLTIRGFQQENVALLLNGVPVSSMENGLVYWSNWSGLTDATEAIQVQRGLGASNVAMNSVGGTVNIITKSTRSQKGGIIRYSLSDFGNQKTVMQFSTGKMKHGTAVTVLGSRLSGDGYVSGTYMDAWSYFLSVSQDISPKHMLVFTAMGSPERHGQKNYPSSVSEVSEFGTRYNSSWGIYNGKMLNLSENFYHKPQINLNHYWNISEKAFLATSAYVSFGHGGGRYTESFNYGPSLWYFRKNNQIDFDQAYLNNLNNSDSFLISNGTWVKNYSKNVLTNYRANHYWVGLLSSMDYSISKKVKLKAGVHLRTFKSHLYEEIDDLMGGKVWIEQFAWSLSGISGREQLKYKGDIINVDNYSLLQYGNLFGQLEYDFKPWQSFLAATISTTAYQRKDPYNYTITPYSDKVSKVGLTSKLV
ncbi:MAG: TonB-dependent receptor [Bacteroidales bacterium]|nr:TonB-dependent receptor [Bacteroidales bacterium]